MSRDTADGRSLRYRDHRSSVLARVTEYVLENGVSGFSLRSVAASVGVSHASLLRHFGSREGLLVTALDHIRADFAIGISEVLDDPRSSSPTDDARSMWRALCEPSAQRQFLLLFELVDRPGAVVGGMESLLVTSWIDVIVDRLVLHGWSRQDARPVATLLLAQFRGLQLDLLVTRDRARVDRAVESALRLLEPPDGHPPSTLS